MLPVGWKKISNSPEETVAIGKEIGQLLPKKEVICFLGDLGAGKTTLIKGIAAEITGLPTREINSPTFNYLNIYEGKRILYHFDCYRLKDYEDFLVRGLDEYLDSLCLIEWPERIALILPKNCRVISIESVSKEERRISYEENSL